MTETNNLTKALCWFDQATEMMATKHSSLAGLGTFLRSMGLNQGLKEDDIKGTGGPLCDTIRMLMSRRRDGNDKMWDAIGTAFGLPDNETLDGVRNEYAYCILYSLLITDVLLGLLGAGYIMSQPVQPVDEGEG
ncbi:hypothetical protein LCGC14_0234750 [marine sediment metagenome]|uniref:Uncharacterized protein n=1 Tax=marine sediment metagenome TaxID=412755 RepID=A0A0F9UD88_9ZZZZ